MGHRALKHAFEPRSVAIVGATDRAGTVGDALVANLGQSFDGPLYFVNSSARLIAGRRSVARAQDLPEAPDLAVIAAPGHALLGAVSDMAEHGAKAAVIVTDALRDNGPEIDALRRAAGPMRLVGPCSLGVINPWAGLHASLIPVDPKPGGLAFVGQSATSAGPIVDWANEHGIGVSHVVCLGKMADVTTADVFDHLVASRRAQVVVVDVEDVPDPRRFLSAARALARVKPVLAMRSRAVGEPPARDAVFDAAFARAGMVRVRTPNALFDALEALLARKPSDPRPATVGDRLAVLANGTAMAGFATDAVEAEGVRIARLSDETVARLDALVPGNRMIDNPINILPDADPARFAAALEAVMDDRGVDAVLVLNAPTGAAPAGEAARAGIDAVDKRRAACARRPWVFASYPGGEHEEIANAAFQDARIPHLATPSDAVAAYGALLRRRASVEALMETPASRPEAFTVSHAAAAAALASTPSGDLSDGDAHALLRAYNLRVADGREGAHAGAATLRILAQDDPVFGPALRVKLGDRAGRRIDPGVAALPPLNMALAGQTVRAGLAGRVLEGAPADQDAVALTLVQAAQILVDHPQIAAMELDPVWVENGEALIGAARVRTAKTTRARLAIPPYPRQLERVVTDRSGESHLLRPIRPEDEPALIDFIEHLDPEHLRLRFFQPIAQVTHEFAARLTQVDYDREMAMVLTPPDALPGSGPIAAVGRVIKELDGASGEYAVTVASDRQGRGLGRLMMDEIIAYARDAGLQSVFGLVLAENANMLALNTKMGFTAASDPDDPGVVRVTLDLARSQADA